MKNIFYILLLLPTIIFAQYPSNSGQKITLGEQTSADGLIWRGRTSDTANLMTNKLDTSVYLVLDTMTEAMWLYRVTTTPKWNRVVDSLNNMQGTLSVAKGGTGATTFTAANRIPYASSATALTTNSNFKFESDILYIPSAIFNGVTNYGYTFAAGNASASAGLGIFLRGTQGAESNLPTTFGYPYVNIGGGEYKVNAIQTIGFGFNNGTGGYLSPAEIGYITNSLSGYTNGHLVFATRASIDNVAPDEKMRITNAGNVGIGTGSPTARLHVKGSADASEFALKVDDSGSNNLLSVKNNGNVGIGTASPTYRLQIKGTLQQFLQVETTSGGGYGAGFDAKNPSLSGGFFVDDATLGFQINEVRRFSIKSDGNVGIGTASPTVKLEIQENASSLPGRLRLSNNFNTIVTNDLLGDIQFYSGDLSTSNQLVTANIQAVAEGGFGGAAHQTGLAFLTATNAGSPVEVLRIAGNGNVGIGTGSPESPLHINATTDLDQFRITRLAQNNQGLSINAGAGRTYFLNYDGTNTVYPSYIFYSKKGNVTETRMTIEASGAVTINNLGTGPVYSNSGVLSNTPPSDERLKNNITNISWGLNDILKLRPVSFNWKDDRANQGKQFGFIAQEVHSIMPEAIKIFGEDFKYLGLEKDAIYATLVKAVQELSAQVDILKQEIINLKNK